MTESEAVVDLLMTEFPQTKAWTSFSCQVSYHRGCEGFSLGSGVCPIPIHRMEHRHVTEKTFQRQ